MRMSSARRFIERGLINLFLVSAFGCHALAQNQPNIEIIPQLGHSSWVTSVAFSPDGARVLTGSWDKTAKLWDVGTGKQLKTFTGHSWAVSSVAFSPDGGRVLIGSWDYTAKLWDAGTGKPLRTFTGHSDKVWSVAFSPNGAGVLTGSRDQTAKLWDAGTGKLLTTFTGHSWAVSSVAFSPDGARVLTGGYDTSAKLWDAGTGKQLKTFTGHSGWVTSVAFSPDGARVLTGSADYTAKLWDAGTGKLVITFKGHSKEVVAVAFSLDGARVLTGSYDYTAKLWDAKAGQSLVSLLGSVDQEWLAVTPAGFFAGSRGGNKLLAVVRGFEPYSVAQFFDHLYRPDLAAEALKGDPEGKYKDAAHHLNLEAILNTGPAPQLELQNKKTEKAGGTVRLTVRITSTGGGIGEKLIWRINGQTQGNPTPPELKGLAEDPLATATVTETLKVNPSQKNIVEVTAYNGAGLLATLPLRITIDAFGATSEERPHMHVLALGVNAYRMKDYELRYAAKDAKDFAQALKVVGSTLFGEVNVTTLINEQVTRDQIAAAFDQIAAKAKPTDVFVLFLGGHGKSIAGRYYYYPQDLDFASGQKVETDGIGQDQLQKWLAKLGHVTKSLVIVDTCESGAAGGLIRGADKVRETAMDQLQHATGHNLIAAARASEAAMEGYKGHGVLTYALLEALNTHDDASKNEKVKLYDLAAHVQERVPAITQSIWGVRQQPTPKLAGNDFPIGIRQAVLSKSEEIPTTPTHVVIRTERVREKPAPDAPGERELPPGTLIRVVEFAGDWAIVARDGEKMGYVPVEALLKMQ